MSAEALFKRLARKQKDALLAMALQEPFEDVLRRELPDFGEDTATEFVHRELAQQADPAYREFSSKLLPTVDTNVMVGVRTPALRKIAKQLVERADADEFLKAVPHRLFEENQVHAFAIGLEKDYGKALARYESFLPYIDNWATCDQLPTKILSKQPAETLEKTLQWIASGRCYIKRFGIGVLMQLYLDELFEPRFLDVVAATRMPSTEENPASDSDIYYVDMMRAWYFAEALAKRESEALRYFEAKGDDRLLDEWTRRKAIQKAIESRRISPELKNHLRTCRQTM